MATKSSLALSVVCMILMLGSALFARDGLALVACLGGFCAGSSIMSAAFHWPDQVDS